MDIFYNPNTPQFSKALGIHPDREKVLYAYFLACWRFCSIEKSYIDLLPDLLKVCETVEEMIYIVHGLTVNISKLHGNGIRTREQMVRSIINKLYETDETADILY